MPLNAAMAFTGTLMMLLTYTGYGLLADQLCRKRGARWLAFFLLFTFAGMITYNTWLLLGLLAVSLAAFKLSRLHYKEVRFMFVFMLVFLLLNNLFIYLFDPNQGTALYGTRTVLCHLFWRYDITAEQLFYMFNITLK